MTAILFVNLITSYKWALLRANLKFYIKTDLRLPWQHVMPQSYCIPPPITFYFFYFLDYFIYCNRLFLPSPKGGGGGRGEIGLGPRNDVLTTLTLRDGHPIIAAFFPHRGLDFQKQEVNPEMLKKLKKIISCIFVLLAYRICLSVLKLRGKLKRNCVISNNSVISNQQQRARSIYRLNRFCRARIT